MNCKWKINNIEWFWIDIKYLTTIKNVNLFKRQPHMYHYSLRYRPIKRCIIHFFLPHFILIMFRFVLKLWHYVSTTYGTTRDVIPIYPMNYMGNSFSCWESLLIVNYGDFFYMVSRRFSICDIEFLPFLPDGAKRNVISSTFFVANT